MVVHQLTAIGHVDPRHMERSFAATNRLRREGTDNLLGAARAVGVRRCVAQSNGGFTYARTGGPVKTEQDPLDPSPIRPMAAMIAAVEYLEKAVLGADSDRDAPREPVSPPKSAAPASPTTRPSARTSDAGSPRRPPWAGAMLGAGGWDSSPRQAFSVVMALPLEV